MKILPEDITLTEKFDHLLPSNIRTLNYHYHLKTSRIRYVAGGEQARGEWVRALVIFFSGPQARADRLKLFTLTQRY
jgi:hypothetical protein